MYRDLAEHLAKDTGLRTEEIARDATASNDRDAAEHPARDTGGNAAALTDNTSDGMDVMVGRFPVD